MLSLLIFVIISLARCQTFNSKLPIPPHLTFQQSEELMKYFSWIILSPVIQHHGCCPEKFTKAQDERVCYDLDYTDLPLLSQNSSGLISQSLVPIALAQVPTCFEVSKE